MSGREAEFRDLLVAAERPILMIPFAKDSTKFHSQDLNGKCRDLSYVHYLRRIRRGKVLSS